ncbi:cation-efflux pump [Alsobacter sp. SYSU M60028]|uniref:Cation-efflux pump n=1 Tax=Alsobacter ponti TaxID=2962936 RepID=A0ABT1L8J8_9HYPH|nr:cation diffusion facilitator family transporter [Alsobacter ponti]MCP8937719.1 cation-efflux pump [Alsobacter ponti]
MSDHAHAKEQAAFWSIVASGLLTLGKLVAGLMSGSLALISEAGHGLLDTGATILTYFAIRAADKPADEEHHYGHGKIEAVAALIETGLLMVLAAYVLMEAVRRLMGHPAEVEATPLAFAVLVISIVVDFFRYRALMRVAKETRSDALAADALHFSSDLVSSTLVLIGLGATKFGFAQGDTLAAVGVALFIGVAGYRLGKRTLNTLVDAAPAGTAEQMRAIAAETPGIVAVESVRVRPAGAHVFAEIVVSVARTLPLDRVLAIKQRLAEAIEVAIPEASVSVTANGVALDEETVLERVLLIAARRRVPVHHVTVQDLGGRRSVSLDIEVDGRMSLGAAHTVASRFETAIREELGPDTEVETHIEPLVVASLAGRDADPAEAERVRESLVRHAAETGAIKDVHSVRVRETPHGLVVNYHCRVEPTMDVASVHECVDRMEHGVRSDAPRIIRIVSHTEPVRPAA